MSLFKIKLRSTFSKLLFAGLTGGVSLVLGEKNYVKLVNLMLVQGCSGYAACKLLGLDPKLIDFSIINYGTFYEWWRTIDIGKGNSKDKAEFLLGICEGEIEGLEKGPQSFFIEDTPLMNENGELNFEDFNVDFYPGSGVEGEEQLKLRLSGLGDPTSVGEELSYNKPITRYIATTGFEYIDVRLTIAQLFRSSDKKGNLENAVEVMIEYQREQEPDKWINISGGDKPFLIKGTVTSQTAQQFRIKVPVTDDHYIVRVTKKTPDQNNTDSNWNVIYWESYYTTNSNIKEFPYTALISAYYQASSSISKIPSVYGIYKLLRIRVPSNYDPINHTYDGDWDGSFKMAWSDNPAWCLYDFVMNDRYGMNAYATVSLDKWDCYEAGQWCDELVSDGKGGKEPRYTCNLLQTEPTNGREFISYLASLFNAVIVESSSGVLRLFVEKDADAVFLFTPENVTDAGFSYSFTSPETRYNDLKVSFTNPDTNWETDIRRVYDQNDIDINGRVTYDFVAVGCIRSGEAMRRAYYKLITGLTETMSVTFTTNRQAQCLSNFDIILISDPVLGYALSGRVQSISEDRKTIYLRDSIYIENNLEEFTIRFNVPDGIYEDKLIQPESVGRTKVLQLQNPLPDNLPEAATFSISSGKFGMAKPFRIMSIAESEGNPDQYTIMALELNRDKWNASDNMYMVGMTEYSGLRSSSDVPHILDAKFYLSYNPVEMETELTFTPTLDETYLYYSGNYVVYTRLKDYEAGWTQQEVVRTNVITGLEPGEYEIIILPLSMTGVLPTFETAPIFTYTVATTNMYPSNIKNLQAEPNANGVMLSWDAVDDLDLAGYEIRAGMDWETGEVITTNYSGTSFFVPITETGTQYYMVAAKNYIGNYSQYPAYVSSAALIPDDVTAFYATVSNDRVRFDWEQVSGNDIEYEIRLGNNWTTAQKVASVKGNNTTVLLPSGSNITYCIKAKSLLGLYSRNARYTQPDMLLKPDRNIILRYDNGADKFSGYTYNMEPYVPEGSEEAYDNMLVLKDTAIYGEHFFPVTLEKDTRARNWLETTAFSNPIRLRWQDLKDVRYSNEQAHVMWIGAQNLESDGSIQAVIAKWIGTENWGGYIAFPYEKDAKDIRGDVVPTSTSTLTFTDGYLGRAMVFDGDTHVNYEDITIPAVFTLTFKMKISLPEETKDRPLVEGVNYLTLAGDNQQYIRLFLYDKTLVCQASDGNDITLDIKHATDLDFTTIALVQSETERVLYFYSDYVNFETYKVVNATPIGEFNKFYINKKIGEIV